MNYYKILSSFQYRFNRKDGKEIVVNCREGEVRKLSQLTAIKYRPYVELACPGGHWDLLERQCVYDMGGSSDE